MPTHDFSSHEGQELNQQELDWLNETRPVDPTPLASPYSLYMTTMSRGALHIIFYDDLTAPHSGNIHQMRFARYIFSLSPQQAMAMAQSLLHSAQVCMANGYDFWSGGEEIKPPEPFPEDAFHRLWPQLYGEHVPEVGPLPEELKMWLPDVDGESEAPAEEC